MPVLTPQDAIDAAIGSYSIESGSANVAEEFVRYPTLLEKFDFEKGKSFDSKTGAFLIKAKSGFVVAAMGKGRFKGEALIAIRGTAGALDWITDANMGIQTSSTGKIVHAGFNRVFHEFETDLLRFMRRHNPARVHCVGHSLGGALAGLTADWVSHNDLSKPLLYTFGSPRIGFKPFSDRLTQSVGNENIFRVHHSNDIVSFVPAWPYTHVPQPGISCNLKGKGFSPISAHYKENYSHSLKGVSDWSAIKIPEVVESNSIQIKRWLSMDTVSVLSSYTLDMISGAIGYILKVAGIGIQMAGIAGLSVLDKLSYALDSAVKTSKEAAGLVKLLLAKILSIVGKAKSTIVNMTTQFLRWVFDLLASAIYRMASLALRATS